MNIIVDRKVIEQALEALDYVMRHGPAVQKAKDLLQTALEQPEQEPVREVWCGCGDSIMPDSGAKCGNCLAAEARLPLTDEEILTYRYMIDWTAEWSYINFARAIEAAHNIKD